MSKKRRKCINIRLRRNTNEKNNSIRNKKRKNKKRISLSSRWLSRSMNSALPPMYILKS